MKIFFLLSFLSFAFVNAIAQPGKYAGTKKNLIGKIYTDSRNIAGLEGWQFREGSVITPLENPEMITVDVFQKGATFLVFFSIKEDTASAEFVIADVLEIKPVVKGWTVKTSFCRQNKIENSWIVAWAKEAPTEYLKILKKAWRFNPDKRRIEIINIKGIDCLNEGFDLT